MTDAFAQVAGQRVSSARVLVGAKGPWVAEVDLEGDGALSGSVELKLGTLSLRGTVDASAAGTFGLQRRARIVAGGGGWGNTMRARGYHEDAGVKALLVAQDAAREAGESLGTFTPRAERLGRDYARQALPAATALENAAGGANWWVGYDGVTVVGSRPTNVPAETSYQVMAYDPRTGRATLAVDDPAAVVIGSVLSKGLDAPITVRELQIVVTAEELRVVVTGGGASEGALASVLRSLVARLSDSKLFGIYRYRVALMSGDRVQLQAVRQQVGLPDLLPLSMWPGVAGCHAQLTPGAEVLVEFIEGDRAQPIVTHFSGKDGTGFAPLTLVIGGPAGPAAARVGDTVQVTLPPAAFAGTIGGSPATGTVTWVPPATAQGTITSGSLKVSIV